MKEPPDPVILRQIDAADIPACTDVFYASVEELYTRLNQPGPPRDPSNLSRLMRHFLEHDAERAWLAETVSATGDPNPPPVVGFGAATLREQSWYLALLFVHPTAQAAGIGRQLLLRTLPRGPIDPPEGRGHQASRAGEPGESGRGRLPDASAATGGRYDRQRGSGTLSTCVDSIQPISTGLYAGYGIVPRVPLYTAIGRPERGSFAAPPRDVVATPADALGHNKAEEALAAVDRATLGYARPVDHAFWRSEGRRAVVLRRSGSGEVLGYGYTQPSGRIGPAALLDETLTAAFLGSLIDGMDPPGAYLVLVPGCNDRGVVALLRAGFRFEGFPGVVSSTRPLPGLERYLAASFALL